MTKKILFIFGFVLLATLVVGGTAVNAGRYLYPAGGYAVPTATNGVMAPEEFAQTPTVFSSTTEKVICSGECIIDKIVMTSGTAGAYLVLRDTGTADGSGTDLTGNLIFGDFSKDGNYSRDPLLGKKVKSSPAKGVTADLSSVDGGESVTIFWHKIGD